MQAISNFFADLGYWNWIIAAFGLAMLEMVVPGVHFLWFGVAALVVGMLTAAFDFAWQIQLISFGVIAVLTVVAVNKWARGDKAGADAPELNQRGRQYIGRTLTVEKALIDGRGKVRVEDTLWIAQGPDMPVGASVKVTGVNGIVLLVEAT